MLASVQFLIFAAAPKGARPPSSRPHPPGLGLAPPEVRQPVWVSAFPTPGRCG